MDGLNSGHRKRMKERFRQEGLDSFAPHNKLEFLLFFAKPQGDTNGLAHVLMERFGSYSAVLDASYEDLMDVPGVGEHTALLLKLVPASCRAYLMDQNREEEILDTAEKRVKFLQCRFVGVTREQAHVLLLDNKCRLLRCQKVCDGDLTSVPISARNIAEEAFRVRASSVVLAHNHPVGYAMASHADVAVTMELKETLGRLGLLLLDHIIIASGDSLSMASAGIGSL